MGILLKDLEEVLLLAQQNISNANINLPTPIRTGDTPPRFEIPQEELARVKREYAILFSGEISKALYKFMNDFVVEKAKEIAQQEISALKQQIEDLKTRISTLEG